MGGTQAGDDLVFDLTEAVFANGDAALSCLGCVVDDDDDAVLLVDLDGDGVADDDVPVENFSFTYTGASRLII